MTCGDLFTPAGKPKVIYHENLFQALPASMVQGVTVGNTLHFGRVVGL